MTILNILVNKHRKSIHNDCKKIRGEWITLSKPPRAAKEANKLAIYVYKKLGSSDALSNPTYKSKGETQLEKKIKEKGPFLRVIGFKNIHFNGTPWLGI